MLKVYPVLCREGYMDNYAYILIDEETQIAAVVDPSEEERIIESCEKLGVKPKFLLCTHHHFDHVDGAKGLKEKYGAQIVCNKKDAHRIEGCDVLIEPDGEFVLGKSVAKIVDVSAHTQGHILYYFEKDKILFTGDTLFNLCIGGLFEGSAKEMFDALAKIKEMPDDVFFYPGHEYTMGGASQAFYYNNGNENIQKYMAKARARIEQGLPVAPVALGEEKLCNPYLQVETLKEFANL